MHLPLDSESTRAVGCLRRWAFRLGLPVILALACLGASSVTRAQTCYDPVSVSEPSDSESDPSARGEPEATADTCPEPPEPPEPPPPSDVIGYIDGISGGAIVGWACSTYMDESISVHLYLGGAAGSGTYAAKTLADRPSEAAVANACKAQGTRYRFAIAVTNAMVTQYGGKAIYIHGISPVGRTNSLISRSGDFTIPVNAAPKVSLTAPAAGASATAPATFGLSADATDADDGVASVTFYANGTAVNTDSAAPYAFSWSGVGAGTHKIHAIARDTRGASAASASVSVTVEEPNAGPAISLTSPADGTTGTAPATFSLRADASDPDGVEWVAFYANGQAVGVDTTAPYAFNWSDVGAGTHTIHAVARDMRGASTTSRSVSVVVEEAPNEAPVVSLTSPADGASGTAPATFVLRADASDPDDDLASVTFYANSQALHIDIAAPYEYSWSGVGAGTHTIHAVAKDLHGAIAISQNVSVTVSSPPPPPPSGPATITRHYVYDAQQRLCKVIEPETDATVMHYDAAGNLDWSAGGLVLPDTDQCNHQEAIDSRRRVTRQYDSRNRLTALVFPDGNGNQSWSYTPDGLPNQVITANDHGANTVTNTYDYNSRRLPTREVQSQSDRAAAWSIDYSYNGNGHLASLAYPAGLTVDYAPNALGQPTRAGSFATGVSYYPNGAIRKFTYGNGLVHTMTQNARQLPERSRSAYGSTAVHDDSLDYDYNGNVAAISDGLPGHRGDRTMSYDGLDRLTATTSPMFPGGAAYTYDVLDNLRTVTAPGRSHTYHYDSHWRLHNVADTDTGAAVIGLDYDAQGNLANKNGQAYVFDYGNRLRSATELEHYRYDAHGRRVQKTTPANAAIHSVYSQNGQLLFVRDERASKRLQYVYLGGSLVAARSRPIGADTEQLLYYHNDALGSPVATTGAGREQIQRSEYEPFGKLLNRSDDDRPGYTGHVMDEATGLTYMQQRYYDPTLGRFLSVDPVSAREQGDNFNRYWYANNNPYKFTDPDGREIRFAPGTSPEVMRSFAESVRYLNSGGAANGIGAIHASETVVVTVRSAADRTNAAQTNYNPNTKEVTWADQGAAEVIDSTNGEKGVISPALALGHEFEHAMNDIYGDGFATDANTFDSQYDNQEERNVIEEYERPAAERLGEPQRGDHFGTSVKVECSVPECK